MARRKATRRVANRRRQDRAARALARGKSLRQAARLCGETTKRALEGVTYAEWLKNDPWFQARVEMYLEKSMSGPEWEDTIADVARMRTPVEVVVDGQGKILRTRYDRKDALAIIGRARGKLKDNLADPGASDTLLGAFLTTPADKLAALATAAAEVLRSAPKGA